MKQIIRIFIVIVVSLAAPAMTAIAETGKSSVKLSACKPDKLGDKGKIDFSTYGDKLIYVDFWASWCGPCRLSFPFLNELHEEFNGKGLAIVAISVDKKESDAKKFLARTPANFTLAIDSNGACPKTFDIQGMPSSFIIDKHGKILFEHSGFRPSDPEKIRKALSKLL